jgi:hypothetical protein
MAIQKLPRELISLVHHIELNKAGWWDKALEQFLIATLWISGHEQSISEILTDLRKTFQVQINEEKARKHLGKLSSKGILMELHSEYFKISEKFLNKYNGDIAQSEALERSVAERFEAIISKCCPQADPVESWKDFNERFLLPLIREVGANTYTLLAEGNFQVTPARFARFVKPFAPELHDRYREVVTEFLDPRDANLREYILRTLNAYFFIEASSLTEDTIEALIKLSGSPPTFIIFVDTNFLFAILGLVPSAADGQSVVDLVLRLKGRITVKLYALPATVDETRRTMISAKQRLAGMRMVRNLAEAASRMNLDSLQVKFFEESPKRNMISVEDYFDPYINDLISMMRAKGVELYNEDLDGYKTKQSVVDDIISQLDLETKYKERPKNYERLEHDMILWHAARDRRPIRIESPLDAQYWVVTVDYRMLGFDKFKKRQFRKQGQENIIPVCLYPTALIQMLQFWVPRTAEFEEAMLSSMRLPFLYREFDPASEKVTIDILKTLSQYEGIQELETETVSSMLVNTALRTKMASTKGVEKKAELIREALVQRNKETKAELDAVTKQLRLREQELEAASRVKTASDEELALRTTNIRELEAALQTLKMKSQGEKAALADRVTQLEQDAIARNERGETNRQRLRFALTSFAIFAVVFILMIGLAILLTRAIGWKMWQSLIGCVTGGSLLWALALDWWGQTSESIKQWSVFKSFHRLRRWIFGALVALAISVLANFVYGSWKQSL